MLNWPAKGKGSSTTTCTYPHPAEVPDPKQIYHLQLEIHMNGVAPEKAKHLHGYKKATQSPSQHYANSCVRR